MHGSSSLAACPRLTGVCPSSFRGHVGSLFSPDYSRYWPPWGLPTPTTLAHVYPGPALSASSADRCRGGGTCQEAGGT